jgi:cell division protein ZapB
MDYNELKLLEDKTKVLINSFHNLKQERDKLINLNEEKSNEINDLKSQISLMENERNEIRNRIEGLISKINEISDISTEEFVIENE